MYAANGVTNIEQVGRVGDAVVKRFLRCIDLRLP
jgi:hypothetical protein